MHEILVVIECNFHCINGDSLLQIFSDTGSLLRDLRFAFPLEKNQRLLLYEYACPVSVSRNQLHLLCVVCILSAAVTLCCDHCNTFLVNEHQLVHSCELTVIFKFIVGAFVKE